jgi:hypothetical protein
MTQENWNPSYWQNDNHGHAWARVKDAMKQDWEQPEAEVSAGGPGLAQKVSEHVKQPRTQRATWPEVEVACRYGYAAHQHYSLTSNGWDDGLETKLSAEWDASKTGKLFKEVRPFVRRGWDYKL